MLSYISQLHHDMADLGYQSISGINGVSWIDFDNIHVLRQQLMMNALSVGKHDRYNTNNKHTFNVQLGNSGAKQC